jgi:hypothetical protein
MAREAMSRRRFLVTGSAAAALHQGGRMTYDPKKPEMTAG